VTIVHYQTYMLEGFEYSHHTLCLVHLDFTFKNMNHSYFAPVLVDN